MENIEEKLNFLLTRRNDLKKSGQLEEDEERELLLNKAIIMGFLELEDIKNEGITLNLLSFLRDELNKSEELNYANKKLIGNHRLLECTHASEVFFSGKNAVGGAVTKDNNLIVTNKEEKYVPIGTKWVFLKGYENSLQLVVWGAVDMQDYSNDIANNIYKMLGGLTDE